MKTNKKHEQKREEFDAACEKLADPGVAMAIKNINPEIYRNFKVACAANGVQMRLAIIELMRQYGNQIK